MNKAKELLETTNMKIFQIAKEVGFPITHTSAEVSESFSEIHRKHAGKE